MNTRRNFLKSGLLVAGAISVGGLACTLSNLRQQPGVVTGFGPLRPVPDSTTGLPLLMLPDGFRYHTFGWGGSTLADGHICPGRADGMGVIANRGHQVTLVRNHEGRGSPGPIGASEHSWDNTGGGTTTLIFDTQKEIMVDARVSLSGTLLNCAGGVTPWGTWLSCEEAPFNPELMHLGGDRRQARWKMDAAKQSHGYVFEVPEGGLTEPKPLLDMGQFYHEAAAVDPDTGIVYMTEDQSPISGFYRFIPNQPGKLAAGGRLQMMKVVGHPDLRWDAVLNKPMSVQWVDIDDPGQGHNPGTHDGLGVASQGQKAGGSVFIALEGCAWGEDRVYFTSKYGGQAKAGYVFSYWPAEERLELIYESIDHDIISGPDNVVLSPRGSLVICEDVVSGNAEGQRLAGLNQNGELFYFCQVNPMISGSWGVHNLVDSALDSEWAGATFSGDGNWLFANIYHPGITVAITGPWQEGLI